MLFHRIVQTSESVRETRLRLRKIEALADCLRLLGSDEILAGVGFLTGELRQGRLGVGPAVFHEARSGSPPAAEPTLGIWR